MNDLPSAENGLPTCGSCGEPAPYTITLRGEPMPACLRHLNHWRTPSCPDCGGLNGQHGSVHVRYGNGGGGNRPCPRVFPPETIQENRP